MSSIRSHWTTLILHTTSFIQRKKAELVTAHTMGAFFTVIHIIAAECFLGVISLPLYLVAKPAAENTADGGQYRIRRTMTLSIIIVIIIIWVLKLLFILWLSLGTDSRAMYFIRETETKNDVASYITTEITIAPVVQKIPKPVITAVRQNEHHTVTVEGQSTAGALVALYLTDTDKTGSESGSVHMYADRADATGHWSLTEDEHVFSLPPGSYIASAVEYNESMHTKSATSDGVAFVIRQPTLQLLFHKFDTILNVAAAIFLLVGVGGMVLML